MQLLVMHLTAFLTGVLLDRIIGDPAKLPHPIRWIGAWIGLGERVLCTEKSQKEKASGVWRGIVLVLVVALSAGCICAALLLIAYRIHPYLGMGVEAILTCYALAAKSLRKESCRVCDALMTKTVNDAREAVSRIVGRDTQELDPDGIVRAAVETVAENTSDGVIAPLLFLFFGGPVAGYVYKAVNTMDSMIGYHNERYEYFGKAAAKLDDVLNFIPARVSALLMILSAYAAGAVQGDLYSGRGAARIFARDRYKHKSPNSAQTESVCAGALSVRLAGPAGYFGRRIEKPWIGDDIRPVEAEDIKRACLLMDLTELFCLLVLLAIAAVVFVILRSGR